MCRRILALLIALAVGIFFVETIPVVHGETDYSIIRVRLASMGNVISAKIKVNGNYSIPENGDIHLQKNKEYEIGIQNGKLILKDGNTVYALGNKFTFKQHKGENSDVLSVLNSSYGWTNYKGDMVVTLEGGYVRFTNHVYLETYLYGVLPYEMSNSWPLEALKAQAVAARTYAVRYKKPASSYDVVDTQDSQVYRGYDATKGNCIRAVDETARMVLKYNGGFVSTFYSSSNGGWVEAGYEVFSGITKDYKPLTAKEDPYDPRSQWSFSIYKTQIDMTGKDLTNPASWWNSVVERDATRYGNFIGRLKNELKAKTSASDVKIVSIDEMGFEGETEGKRKREVYFKLSFYMKNGQNGYVMDDQGNISLGVEEVKFSTMNMRSAVGTTIMKSLYVTGLELRNQDTPGQEDYIISGVGFGHGVGMSQWGAKAMAEQNKTYREILAFYYPEATVEVLNISPPGLTDMPSRGNDRPDPQPSNGDTGGGTGQQPQPVYGVVKVTTSLNVRQGPGTQYKRIGGLGPNTRVQILRQVGEWYEIKSGNLQGYVSSNYVVLEGGQQPPGSSQNNQGQQPPGSSPGGNQEQQPPVDPPVPPGNDKKYAVVTASALNVRSGPSTKNHKIGMVVKGNRVTVLEKAGEWYKIEYNGLTGYVHGSYIKLEATSTQPSNGGSNQSPGTSSGNVIARGTVTASTLNVRAGAGTGFKVIGKLAKNAKVDILEKAGAWYKIKYGSTTGYVHGDYIKLESNDAGSRGEQSASVGTVTASALNVRSGPGTNYSKVGILYLNSQVTILGQSGVWYKVKFGSTTGYVHSAYVKVSNAASSRGDDNRDLPITAIVTATWLNVRTGPGVNYASIGAIKMNSQVTVLQKQGSWYKVSYGTLTGYVSGDYLKF